MVRAKFKCTAVNEVPGQKGRAITMSAISDGSEENKAFFAATPSASLTMSIVSQAAAEQFEVGASYYLDFTRAE